MPTALNERRRPFGVTKAETEPSSTEWPGELGDGSDALEQVLGELANALAAADATAEGTGELAETVHDVEHDFSGEVWAYIYRETDVESGAADHD